MIQWSSVHCTQAICYNGWGEGREGKCAKMFGKSAFSRSVRSVFERCLFAKKKKKRGNVAQKEGEDPKKTQQFPFFSVRICSKAGAIFFLSAIGHFASCCPTLPGGIERGPDSVRVFRVFSYSPRTYRKFWLLYVCTRILSLGSYGWWQRVALQLYDFVAATGQQQQYEDGRGEGKNKLDTLDLNYSSAMRRCRREKNYCSYLEMLRGTIRL